MNVLFQAGDVDTILRLHTDYVDHIHDRCLLNKKVSLIISINILTAMT